MQCFTLCAALRVSCDFSHVFIPLFCPRSKLWTPSVSWMIKYIWCNLIHSSLFHKAMLNAILYLVMHRTWCWLACSWWFYLQPLSYWQPPVCHPLSPSLWQPGKIKTEHMNTVFNIQDGVFNRPPGGAAWQLWSNWFNVRTLFPYSVYLLCQGLTAVSCKLDHV